MAGKLQSADEIAKAFVAEQSQGEWGEEVEARDAARLAAVIHKARVDAIAAWTAEPEQPEVEGPQPFDLMLGVCCTLISFGALRRWSEQNNFTAALAVMLAVSGPLMILKYVSDRMKQRK